MNKSFLSLACVAVSCVGISAFAADPQDQKGPTEQDISVLCPNLSLSQAQKDQFTQLGKATHGSMKAERAALKTAKAEYRAALADPNMDQNALKQKEDALKNEVNKTIDLVLNSADQAALTIFTPAQRADGVACLEKVRKEAHDKWMQKKCSATTPQPSDEGPSESDMMPE